MSRVAQSVERLGYGPEDGGSIPGRGNGGSRPDRLWDSPQPPTCIPRLSGTLTPEVRRPGREADHSPPSSAEVKKAWSYNSTPQYDFMVWCLTKQEISLHGVVLS
jgi:hypothetical protein